MDEGRIKEIKECYEVISGLMETIESAYLPLDEDGEMSLKECFQIEVKKMMMYFMASDGEISYEEAKVINEIFGEEISPQGYAILIDRFDIYSTEFESGEFVLLEYLKCFDKELGISLGKPAIPIVVDFIESLAKAVITCDGEIDEQEKEDFYLFMRNLRTRYLDENQNVIVPKKKGIPIAEKKDNLKDYYLKKKI